MNINFEFLPQGARINILEDVFEYSAFDKVQKWPKNNTLILDTGNELIPGIVDHHQPNNPEVAESCVTSLIISKAEKYLGHLKNQETVNVITHFVPDLDASASVYFAIKFLEGAEFGEKEQLIADYVLEVDSGKLSIDPENPLCIASLWLAVTDEQTDKRPHERDNRAILEKGIQFFDEIMKTLSLVQNPKQSDFGSKIEGFNDEKMKIVEDAECYNFDLEKRSSIHTLELLNIQDGGTEFVDAIFTRKPESFLWKYWVRGDKKNSRLKQGFILTCAHWDNRSIISVDPNTPYNLKGLGILIDRVEIDKLSATQSKEDIILGFLNNENNRPGIRQGFHRNDPWYDGRGFHKFTIIDAPRAGTLLSKEEIDNLILNVPLWYHYGLEIEHKLIGPMGVDNLIAMPAPVFEGNDPLLELSIPEKFEENDLSLSNQKPHLEIFFRAKRFSRAELLQQRWYKNSAFRYVKLLAEALNALDTKNFYELKEQYCELIRANMEPFAVKVFLEYSEDFTKAAFDICIQTIENYISNEDKLSFYFKLQHQHPSAFYLKNGQTIQNEERIHSFLSSYFINPDTMYELPIYAFNNLKNYFDDVLVQQLAHSDILKRFIASDFTSMFNDSGISGILDKLYLEFKEYREIIIKSFFGNNYEDIKEKRNELIPHLKGNPARKIKQYSTQDLLNINFETYQEINLTLNATAIEYTRDYLQVINFLQNLSALENLFQRLFNFSKLKNDTVNSFFKEYPYFSLLNEITYNLFYAQSIYLQASKSDDIEPILKNVLNQLNSIRTIHDARITVDLSDLCDASSRFSLNLISELSQPFEDPEQKLNECLDQYYLICGTNGIIETLEKLPFFYQQLWRDIFTGYKRYYSEKIVFLREQLIRLSELTDSAEEDKATTAFDKLYVELINESVKYDWQELKDYVDKDNFNHKDFYEKYFYWKFLNNRKEESIDVLAKFNSELRFAVGNVSTFNETLIKCLPATNFNDNKQEERKKIFLEQNFNQIITHLPNSFLHQCFDFISKLYINRFDVDTARKGLFSYSSRFPWYYTLFTKTYVIRFLTLFLVLMLFLAGLFDKNVYKVEEVSENAPASVFIKNILGDNIFLVFHYLSSGFWMILLSLTFILPFVVLILLLKNLIFKKSSTKGLQLKFLELIQAIETNNSNLLYLSFLIPLLFVILQMTNSDTIGMINNITGIRLASTFIIVLGLTIAAVFMYVRKKNRYKGINWIMKRTEHMFWLHLLQAMLISIFIIDILLRLEINLDNFTTHDALFTMGISKFIRFEFGPFDFIVMPVFTVLVSLLTLFFSFFIDKVLGTNKD